MHKIVFYRKCTLEIQSSVSLTFIKIGTVLIVICEMGLPTGALAFEKYPLSIPLEHKYTQPMDSHREYIV